MGKATLAFVAAETVGGPFVYQKYLINICKCKLCKIQGDFNECIKV